MEKMAENNNQIIAQQLNALGYDFGQFEEADSPESTISALLDFIGNVFGGNRVYIFEKNEDGCYCCTDEWVSETTYPKKHLMQNIEPRGVRFYYNYFLRGDKLSIRDMEEFKQEDYHLYKILKPQNLKSVICEQLVFDEQDIGFFGIDNPSEDKFDELEKIMDVLGYFITIQIHKRNLEKKLKTKSHPVSGARQYVRRYSLYDRISKIKIEEPLALIYCNASLKFFDAEENKEILARMFAHTEKVLGSIFGNLNVFHLGKNEFLVFYEDNEDMDISNINHYAALTQETLEAMNIVISMGAAVTKKYRQDFFELVHKANVRMLRLKGKYRDVYTEKYHLHNKKVTFTDLIEIRPEENSYQILYSEHSDIDQKDGKFDQVLQRLSRNVYREDRKRFLEFWEERLCTTRESIKSSEGQKAVTESFSVYDENRIVSVQVTVVPYTDVHGEVVLMCYTK